MGFYFYMAWDGMLWDGDGDGIYKYVSMAGWLAYGLWLAFSQFFFFWLFIYARVRDSELMDFGVYVMNLLD